MNSWKHQSVVASSVPIKSAVPRTKQGLRGSELLGSHPPFFNTNEGSSAWFLQKLGKKRKGSNENHRSHVIFLAKKSQSIKKLKRPSKKIKDS